MSELKQLCYRHLSLRLRPKNEILFVYSLRPRLLYDLMSFLRRSLRRPAVDAAQMTFG